MDETMLSRVREAIAADRLEDAARLCDVTSSAADRGFALALLGGAYHVRGRLDSAQAALERAAELVPEEASVWTALGAVLAERGDYDRTEAVLLGACTWRGGGPEPHVRLARLYLRQERTAEAVDQVQAALALDGSNADALFLLGLLSARLEERSGLELAIVLLERIGAPAERLEILRRARARLTDAAPQPVERRRHARAAIAPAREWSPDEIAIVCGRTPHVWSPRSLEEGIGGSEEAVIRLARALAEFGWRVTVYNECGADAGLYDGVLYRPFELFNRADRFNVVIGWRNVRLFDAPVAARRTALWLHDVVDPCLFTRRRLAHIDQLLVLSDFHRALLPDVPDEKLFVTSNGIDVELVERVERRALPRDPHRCLWASSYDRGLEELLVMWPSVREAVPAAELHVCYGWESFASRAGDPSFETWRARMERLLEQPGVVHRGRLGQEQVIVETFRAGVWAYPTTFPETSCITAMKAQAAGAVPVTIGYAALRETVRYGRVLPASPDGRLTPEQADAYRNALVAALRDAAWQERVRREMMPWARLHFSWHHVAQQWHARFRHDPATLPVH